MNLRKFLGTFERSQQIVAKVGMSNVFLVIICLILAVMAFGNRERLVFIPPFWNAKMEAGIREADQAMYQSWGMYFASLIGNVTPENVEASVGFLDKFLGPAVREAWRTGLHAQAADMKRSGHSIYFAQRRVEFESATKKTFVIGTQHLIAKSGRDTQSMICYELVMDIVSGLPVITALQIYEGEARTLKWLKLNETKLQQDERKKEKEKLNASR